MPKAKNITKATKSKAKTTTKAKTKTTSQGKIRGKRSVRKVDSSSSNGDVQDAAAAAQLSEGLEAFLFDSQKELCTANSSKTSARRMKEAGHQERTMCTAKKPWGQVLLSELSVSRAPIIHAMPSKDAFYHWLDNDCHNDLSSGAKPEMVTWLSPTLTTEELQKYNVVGLRAHLALTGRSRYRQDPSRWRIYQYMGSDDPLNGTLWFAVLIRDELESDRSPELTEPGEPGGCWSMHGDVDGSFYWDASRRKSAEESGRSSQLSENTKPKRSSGFCWGIEACGGPSI